MGESPAQRPWSQKPHVCCCLSVGFLVPEIGAIVLTHRVVVPTKSDKARNARLLHQMDEIMHEM